VAVPGALLGYLNADHWALAMRLSQVFPALSSQFIDDVPHGAILAAAIAVVARDLQR
jgi:5,10-methenyltetrahydromethanopterin hydrogenase